MIFKYTDFIIEKLTDYIYHFTTINKLENILKNNSIHLSSVLANSSDFKNNKGFYFLSLSRSKSPKLGYGLNISAGGGNSFVRIELNGHKLNHQYKSSPYDYWNKKGDKYLMSTNKNQFLKNFEYEERIFSNKSSIDNINTYINKIDIFTTETDASLNQIRHYCDELNIIVNFYTNINDFIKNTNAIDIEPEHIVDDKKHTFDSIFLDKVLTLLFLPSNQNELFTDELESKIQNFIEIQGFNVRNDTIYKVCERMHKLFCGDTHISDFILSINADIHNASKAGFTNKNAKLLTQLVSDYLVRNKFKSIKDAISAKVYGYKNEPKQDYSKKFRFVYEDNIIPNDEKVYYKIIYCIRDMMLTDKQLEMRELKSNAYFINWLMNSFNTEKLNLFKSIIKSETEYELCDKNKLKLMFINNRISNKNRADVKIWDDIDPDDFIKSITEYANFGDNDSIITKLINDNEITYLQVFNELCVLYGEYTTLKILNDIRCVVKIKKYN